MADRETPKHVIKLTVNPSPVAEKSGNSDVSRPWYQWLRRRRLALLAVGVVGVSVLVGYHFLSPQSPEDIARDFMESVQAGDVEAAMEFVELDPTTAREDLLVPEAVSDDWDITSIETINEDSDLEVATVRVAISNDAGEQEMGDFQFTLNEHGEWELRNGLTYLDVSGASMTYLEANGIHVPLEESERGIFALFPGTYTFYEAQPPNIKIDSESGLAVAGRYKDLRQRVSHDAPELRAKLTWRGDLVEDIQAQFDELVDECIETPHIEVKGCPFGLAERGGVSHDRADEWEVLGYPTISLTAPDDHPGKVVLGAHDGHEGMVRGTVTMAGEETQVECDLDPKGMEVVVFADGEVGIAPFDLPDGHREGSYDLPDTTCSPVFLGPRGTTSQVDLLRRYPLKLIVETMALSLACQN